MATVGRKHNIFKLINSKLTPVAQWCVYPLIFLVVCGLVNLWAWAFGVKFNEKIVIATWVTAAIPAIAACIVLLVAYINGDDFLKD